MSRNRTSRVGRSYSPWPPDDWRLTWGLPAALLIVATLLAYIPAIFAGYIWDDDDYVYDNPNLKSPSGLVSIWLEPRSSPQYYPLVHTTYWLEYQLWGLAPAGYHVTNVLAHAANSVLLWRLLRRLSLPGAWLAAAVFALHPVHVESVAWITERKNTLSLLFYLGSAHCFLRWLELPQGATFRRTWTWYGASVVLFLGALLCKTVTATLPAALLVVLWWKHGRLTIRDLGAVGPMFLVGLPLGLFTAWLERQHVGASGPQWAFSLADRCLIAGRAVWFYATKLIFPYPLAFIYPRWRIDDRDWQQYVFPLAAIGLVAALWLLRNRIGRGPLAGVLVFGGTLFPALGFFNVYPMRYSFVADHFQYAASIGLIAVLIAGGTTVLGRHVAAPRRTGLGAMLLALLGVLTFRQCVIYQDSETLWRDTLSKNPLSSMAHTNLGNHLHKTGRSDEAAVAYQEAIRLAIRQEQEALSQHDLAMSYTNLGLTLRETGRSQEAIDAFREAIRLAPQDAVTHNNLALGLADQRDFAGAEQRLRRAIELDSRYWQAISNLAIVLQYQEKVAQAEEQFRKAIAINGDDAVLRYNFGTLLHGQKHSAEAIEQYQQAVRLSPEFLPARYNLATALIDAGDPRQAEAQLQMILRQNPSFPGAAELLEKARTAADQ